MHPDSTIPAHPVPARRPPNERRLQTTLAWSALGVAALLGAGMLMRRSHYSFRNRTIIITGASRGLGLELARQLAREGARLWLVARTAADLERAADELRQTGAFVETIAADLRDRRAIDEVVARVRQVDSTIDVVINNAGLMEVGPFEHAQPEDFEDSLAIHFWAPLYLIRRALPYMRPGEGRIVNISSIGGRIAVPHLAPYVAGKFALTGLSETLRAELAKHGVRVTTVTPGLMRTGSYVGVSLRGQHSEELRWFAMAADTPLISMRASRAARQIIEAARRGRAAITPLWQARLAQITDAIAPNTVAAIAAMVDRLVLPAPVPSPDADHARRATEVDPGAVKSVLSEKRRRQYHQPDPAWGGS